MERPDDTEVRPQRIGRWTRRVHRAAWLAAAISVPVTAALAAPFTHTTTNGSNQWTTDVLAAPDPLTCAWTGANSLALTWTDNSTWATGYDAERSNSAGSGYAALASTSGAASVTTTDSNPAPTTLRYYRVRAKYSTMWTGPYSSVTASNTCDGTIDTFHDYGAGAAPTGVAVDSSGNVYAADIATNVVYKTTPAGTTTIYAGNGTAGYSGDGGAATSAMLNGPRGMDFDSSGNLYIADSNNNRVRKVTPGGTISTYAGTGTAGFSGDGGAATSAALNYVPGLSVDSTNTLYLADQNNHRIRKVTTGGVISTVAGNGGNGFSGDGGAATSAQLSSPYDAVSTGSGTLYISDYGNNRIRKVTSGTISTVAGGGATTGCTYSGNGTGASLSNLRRMSWDALTSRLALVENGHCVRLLNGTTLSQTTGSGTAGYSGDDGPAVSGTVSAPTAVAFSSTGDLYIADQGNHAVRRILQP